MEKYSAKWFYEKFFCLSEDQIGTGSLENHCALWHCGVKTNEIGQYEPTEEAKALAKILGGTEDMHNVYDVNDSFGERKYNYPTAKQRLLAALRSKLTSIELEVNKEELILN